MLLYDQKPPLTHKTLLLYHFTATCYSKLVRMYSPPQLCCTSVGGAKEGLSTFAVGLVVTESPEAIPASAAWPRLQADTV